MILKGKKADTNWFMVSMILAIIAAGVFLFINQGLASTVLNNAEGLASCSTQGGTCKSSCQITDKQLENYGCKKTNPKETIFCCIPSDQKKP